MTHIVVQNVKQHVALILQYLSILLSKIAFWDSFPVVDTERATLCPDLCNGFFFLDLLPTWVHNATVCTIS